MIIGSLYPEDIPSRIQVGKAGGPFVTDRDPVLMKSFHLIGILILFRVGKIEGGKGKGKGILVVTEGDGLLELNGSIQLDPFVKDPEISKP